MNWKKMTAAVLAAVVIVTCSIGASAACVTGFGGKLWADDGQLYSDIAADCYTPAPKAGEIWWTAPAATTKNGNNNTGSSCDTGTTAGTGSSCGSVTNSDSCYNGGKWNGGCNPGTNNADCPTGNPCKDYTCPTTPGTPSDPGTPSVPELPSTPDPSGVSEIEMKMVALVNAERTAQGLKPLTINSELTNVAREKSRDMIANNYFDHNSPTYGSPFDMMKKFGIKYNSAGENIAYNSSMEAAHTALMNSAGHRENILKGSFTQIGIGIVKSGSRYYITQMFIG